MRAHWVYWLFFTFVLGGAAVYLAGPPDARMLDAAGSDQRTAYITIFTAGFVILWALQRLFRQGMASLYNIVALGTLIALASYAHNNRAALLHFYDVARGNIYPSVALSTTGGEELLLRGWDGHYRAKTEINGIQTKLLVDTGASMVLLPHEIAEDIGIDPDTLDYSIPVTTANGKSTVAPVTLSSVKVGQIEVRDVSAAIAHPGRLKSGLLGMSFLDKLSETSFRGGKLYLTK